MRNFLRSAVSCFFVLIPLLSTTSSIKAAELGEPDKLLSLDVHGFISQGFILTTDNDYLTESRHGSFEFTEVGINFTKPLTDRLRAGLQLFSRKIGAIGNYNVKADWYYLDYRFADELGIRAGRVKLPFGLYNDSSDIDSARVPILLPQSIYPTGNRDFLLAQTGGELYGRVKFGGAGTFDYRFYGGQIYVQLPSQLGNPIVAVNFENPYIVGGRLMWETPMEGLRIGGSLQALRFDTDIVVTATGSRSFVEIPAVLWIGSAEYAFNDLLLAAEYSRWYTSIRSTDATIFASTPTVVSERMYGMVSYRFKDWFQPGAYYSLFYPDKSNRSGRENMQHDIAATLRFDVNPFWLIKLEGHYMHGTANLDSSLNNNIPQSGLDDDWMAFLIKTTAYF